MKIGIVDDGIDASHPFFNPAGYTPPPGFPKGVLAEHERQGDRRAGLRAALAGLAQRGQAVRPRLLRARHARGRHRRRATQGTRSAGGRVVGGVAPGAYLGNYKVLTVPTVAGVGLNGNSPEIAKGIEMAVRDGMDVVNLSLGEPEIEPSRDLVVRALDGAAAAGVIPVVAAGNDYAEFGGGSITSPGSAARAITVAAVTPDRRPLLAGFSSAGPTPVSLQLKPDVERPRRRDPVVGARARGQLVGLQRNEHGRPARGGRRRAPAPAAPDVDGRSR